MTWYVLKKFGSMMVSRIVNAGVLIEEAVGEYEAQMRPHAQRYMDLAMRNLGRAI